jgi:hypothetical protein
VPLNMPIWSSCYLYCVFWLLWVSDFRQALHFYEINRIFLVLELRTLILEVTLPFAEILLLDSETQLAEAAVQGTTTIFCTTLISVYLVFQQRQQRKLIGMELSHKSLKQLMQKKLGRGKSRIYRVHEYCGHDHRVICPVISMAVSRRNNLESKWKCHNFLWRVCTLHRGKFTMKSVSIPHH